MQSLLVWLCKQQNTTDRSRKPWKEFRKADLSGSL